MLEVDMLVWVDVQRGLHGDWWVLAELRGQHRPSRSPLFSRNEQLDLTIFV
jgi:hypothetical protein